MEWSVYPRWYTAVIEWDVERYHAVAGMPMYLRFPNLSRKIGVPFLGRHIVNNRDGN